jgi:hypothetical protein
VRFLARARGYRAFFTDSETVFVLPRGTEQAPGKRPWEVPAKTVSDVVRMSIVGAKATMPSGVDRLPGTSNYFLGSDPAMWRTGVPHFGAIEARGIRPGIDLHWRGLPGGRLEYLFAVAAGTDPEAVELRFEGARSVTVDTKGFLLVATDVADAEPSTPSPPSALARGD